MKKSKLFPVALMAVCFMSGSSLMAQDHVVKMTTAKNVGEKLTLAVNNTNAGVTVDWGDGTAVAYPKSTTEAICTIEGTVKGANITVSGATTFNTLICEDNKLTALDVSGASGLQSLYCQNNQLTTLNIAALTSLKDLDVSDNQIEVLTGNKNNNFGNLENLNVANNGMTTIAGSKSVSSIGGANMQHLNIANNKFGSVYVSNNTSLETLIMSNLGISSNTLQLQNCPNLGTVVVNGNSYRGVKLPEAGLSELQQIVCDGNQIATIDLSASAALKDVSVANNGMSEIALPVVKLQSMNCGGNALAFNSLPGNKNRPANDALFAYAPQADIDITGLTPFTYSTTYGAKYMPVCPSYADRNKTGYYVDLTDYRKDGSGASYVVFEPVSIVDGQDVALEVASASNKEKDYTLVGSVKLAFLKPFKSVSVKMTHPNYPGLVIRTIPFAVGEENLVGISDIEIEGAKDNGLIYDLQGRRVANPKNGIFIKNGKKVFIK